MDKTIKVTVDGGQTFEGTLHAVDPVTKAIVIRSATGSFSMFSPSLITAIDGTLSFNSSAVQDFGINVHSLEKHEQRALETAEKNITALNSSVSSVIQTLFDRINFIYPSEWQGNTMVVLNEFIISPPYERVALRPGGNSESVAGLERLVKVLEGERKKLNIHNLENPVQDTLK